MTGAFIFVLEQHLSVLPDEQIATFNEGRDYGGNNQDVLKELWNTLTFRWSAMAYACLSIKGISGLAMLM